MNTLTLQNHTLQLKFDRQTGALVEIFARELGWPILTPAHAGLSFPPAGPTLGRKAEQPRLRRKTDPHRAGGKSGRGKSCFYLG